MRSTSTPRGSRRQRDARDRWPRPALAPKPSRRRCEPSAEELAQHHREELAHFELPPKLSRGAVAIRQWRPPGADVWGVASRGAGEVLRDPRTSFRQCLDVMLMIELADNDAWSPAVPPTRRSALPDDLCGGPREQHAPRGS